MDLMYAPLKGTSNPPLTQSRMQLPLGQLHHLPQGKIPQRRGTCHEMQNRLCKVYGSYSSHGSISNAPRGLKTIETL